MITALKSSRIITLSTSSQIFLASLLLALSAQFTIPLYFTPVPLTLQTLAVMFLGVTLGSRKAALSVLLYLLEGSLGLPVFSMGASGFFYLFGPKWGYLFGFLLQAFFIGYFTEREEKLNSFKTLLILMTSSLLQLGLGALGLSLYMPMTAAFTLGFTPFIFGELIKAFLIIGALKTRSPLTF